MIFFLLVLLLENAFYLTEHKRYNAFYATYNSGLSLTILMMLIHGCQTVLGYADSPMISGIAGLGHLIMAVGLGLFFAVLTGQVSKKQKELASDS